MGGTAAILYAGLTVGLSLFQVSLALGAPWGRFAWGGQHERLPTALRIGSGLAPLLYAGLAAVILARAGIVDINGDWVGPASWGIAGFLGLGIILNAASRSLPERLVMTPLAAALCLCALLVALGH